MAFLSHPNRPHPVNPGIQVRKITPRIAAALDLPTKDGLLVENVTYDSPAHRAGVRAGDILLAMDDAPVETPGDISLILARTVPETVTVWRDGQKQTLTMEYMPPVRILDTMSSSDVSRNQDYSFPEMGLSIGLDGIVTETSDGSVGYYSGLTAGDRVLSVNGKALASLPSGWQDNLRFDGPVLLLLQLSDGSTRHILLDPWTTTVQLRPASGANVMDQDVVSFE